MGWEKTKGKRKSRRRDIVEGKEDSRFGEGERTEGGVSWGFYEVDVWEGFRPAVIDDMRIDG